MVFTRYIKEWHDVNTPAHATGVTHTLLCVRKFAQHEHAVVHADGGTYITHTNTGRNTWVHDRPHMHMLNLCVTTQARVRCSVGVSGARSPRSTAMP